jgi:hypothetical protein
MPPAGDVIFSDDFGGETHYLSAGTQEGFGGGLYVDGVYRMTAEPRAGYVNYTSGGTTDGCSGTNCSFPQVLNNQIPTSSVEVDATQTGGSPAGGFGIACAYEGSGTVGFFVGLTISSDGRRYAIAVNDAPGDSPVDFLKGGADRGDPHPAINQGLGAANHLRADCGTESFALWVNHHLVTTAELDEPLGDIGYERGVALIAAPGPDEGVAVDFDNLVVRRLEGEPPVTPEFGLTITSNAMTTDDKSWPTGDFANASMIFTNGYVVTMEQPERIAPIVPLVAMVPPDRLSIGVTVEHLDGAPGQGAGVMCRVTTTGLYSFQVDMQGRYGIFKTDLEGTTPLLDWTESDAIDTTGPNEIQLDCVGDSLTGYINASPAATVFDSSFDSGQYGLFVGSPPDLGDVPTTVQFTDFFVTHQ